MKLIIFAVFIIIIYFIASRIRTNINRQSEKKVIINKTNETNETNETRKIMNHVAPKQEATNIISDESNNLIISDDATNSLINSPTNLPDANIFINLIKKNFLDGNYHFNVMSQPVTNRYPDKNNKSDIIFLHSIRKNINLWDEMMLKYCGVETFQFRNTKLLFITETTSEFIIKLNVWLIYLNKSLYLQLGYYGKIEKEGDFFNDDAWRLGVPDKNNIEIQLIEIKMIPKSDFDNAMENNNQFMTMEEQLKYVDKINKLHADENNN